MATISTVVAREIETLEAELRMALSDASVPVDKRAEFEQRLSAIKAKADTNAAASDSGRAASSLPS